MDMLKVPFRACLPAGRDLGAKRRRGNLDHFFEPADALKNRIIF